MDYRSVWRVAAILSFLVICLGAIAAATSAPSRVSGPHVSKNLAVYFVHGTSQPGPVPLTLAEALGLKTVEVIETGTVEQLTIRNSGDRPVFIQRGDIVKGGRQDRVLTVSMLVPPRSKPIPIGSLCVEQGRWSKRGAEDDGRFSSARLMLPSRKGKIALLGSLLSASPDRGASHISRAQDQLQSLFETRPYVDASPSRQHVIWDTVSRTQKKLSENVGANVAADRSASSLQLSLENKALNAKVEAYIRDLRTAAEAHDDIVGLVFAVNGRINSGDIYPSHGLFMKMWPKLLRAAATEAVGDLGKKVGTPPAVSAVDAFLKSPDGGRRTARKLRGKIRVEIESTDTVVRSTTVQAAGGFVHMGLVTR